MWVRVQQPLPSTNNNPKEKKKNITQKFGKESCPEGLSKCAGNSWFTNPLYATSTDFMLPIGQCEEPHTWSPLVKDGC